MNALFTEYYGVMLDNMAVPAALFLEREDAVTYAAESGGRVVACSVTDGAVEIFIGAR